MICKTNPGQAIDHWGQWIGRRLLSYPPEQKGKDSSSNNKLRRVNKSVATVNLTT